MAYTTDALLAAIKRRCFAPTGQVTFTDDDLLAIADEVIQSYLLPDIVSVREEFFVVSTDYDITANQNAYEIPARASGMVLREIWLVNSDGSITPDFPRKEPEEIDTDVVGEPTGFYLKYNQIILHPTPSTTDGTSIRVFYFLPPSAHVATSAAGLISDIDTGNNIVTVSSIPSDWATADIFDFIKQDGGQNPVAIDYTSTLVSGNTITFASLPTSLRVGDYVALAGQTPLVQLPPEYRPALAEGAAAEVLESMGQPGGDRARRKFDKMRDVAKTLITPRVQGEDRVLTASNWT